MKYCALFTTVVFLFAGCSDTNSASLVGTSSNEQSVLNNTHESAPRITVPDNPPSITVTASVTELWPPNKKWQTVTFSGTLSDYTTASYVLTDEYGKISYSGTLSGSTFSVPLQLKAERKGKDKNGRTYTFTVTATGTLTVEASATVVVPHDKKKHDKDHDDDDEHDDHDDNDGDDD